MTIFSEMAVFSVSRFTRHPLLKKFISPDQSEETKGRISDCCLPRSWSVSLCILDRFLLEVENLHTVQVNLQIGEIGRLDETLL